MVGGEASLAKVAVRQYAGMTFPEDFSSDWLAAYLSRRLGEYVIVESFERFTRGTSRQTWFAQTRSGNGGVPSELVLRTDHPAGSGDPTTLDQEYFIYKCLGRTNLPVAAALWWEGDLSLAPRPFYVRRKIAGSWNIPGYSNPDPANNCIRLAAAQEHLRKLAMVHRIDWRAAGFEDRLSVPASEADAAPNYVRVMMDRLRGFGADPSALLLEVREWLLDHAPVAPRVSLCKGTNGVGEEVFRDGKIVALSDWEEVSIGDPASDLAMVQGFLEPIVGDGETVWDMERALEFYRTESGIDVSLENVRYYQLARLFGRMVMFAYTATVVGGNSHATVRQSWTATEVQHVVRRALASALGLGSPVDSARFDELNQSVEMTAA